MVNPLGITTKNGRAIAALPPDGRSLGEVVENLQGEDVGTVINGLFDGAFQKVNTSRDLPGLFRVTDVKSDIASLVKMLQPVVLGIMHNEIHDVNKYLVPVVVTNDMRFHTEVIIYEPQYPGQTAPMGPSRMLEETRMSNMSQMTRFGFSFIIDGDVEKLPEGKATAQFKLMQIAGSYMQLLAFNTVAALGEADPDSNYMLQLESLTTSQYIDSIMERVAWTGIASKRDKGFFTRMLDIKMRMTELNGVPPTDCIFPEPKRLLLANSNMLVDYQHAGDTAHDMYTGKIKIEQIHGINLWPAPVVQNTGDRQGQLRTLRRLGNYALFRDFPDAHPDNPGIHLYDAETDTDELISRKDVMKGFAFMEKATHDNSEKLKNSVYFAFLRNVMEIALDLGYCNKEHDNQAIFPDWQRFYRDSYRPYFETFNLDRFNDETEDLAGALLTLLDQRGLDPPDGEQDGDIVQLYNAAQNYEDSPENERAHARHTFNTWRDMYFGDEFDFIDPASCVGDLGFIVRTKIAAEFHARTGGAFGTLFRPGGVYSRSRLLSPSSQFVSSVCAYPMPRHSNNVYLLDIEAVLERHERMLAFAEEGTFFCTRTEDGQSWIPRRNVVIHTEGSAFKEFDFILARPAETVYFSKFILLNRGKETAFAAVSPPNMVTNHDAVTQAKYVHSTMFMGVHVVNHQRVVNVPDCFFDGVVGGCNAKVMTFLQTQQFKNLQFVTPSSSFPAVYVIPIPKNTFQAGRFLNLRGTVEIRGLPSRQTPDYPFAESWCNLYGFDGAASEYSWSDNRNNVVATALMPCKYSYMRLNGETKSVPGQTHYGRFGEQTGARLVRDNGNVFFPQVEDR